MASYEIIASSSFSYLVHIPVSVLSKQWIIDENDLTKQIQKIIFIKFREPLMNDGDHIQKKIYLANKKSG